MKNLLFISKRELLFISKRELLFISKRELLFINKRELLFINKRGLLFINKMPRIQITLTLPAEKKLDEMKKETGYSKSVLLSQAVMAYRPGAVSAAPEPQTEVEDADDDTPPQPAWDDKGTGWRAPKGREWRDGWRDRKSCSVEGCGGQPETGVLVSDGDGESVLVCRKCRDGWASQFKTVPRAFRLS